MPTAADCWEQGRTAPASICRTAYQRERKSRNMRLRYGGTVDTVSQRTASSSQGSLWILTLFPQTNNCESKPSSFIKECCTVPEKSKAAGARVQSILYSGPGKLEVQARETQHQSIQQHVVPSPNSQNPAAPPGAETAQCPLWLLPACLALGETGYPSWASC